MEIMAENCNDYSRPVDVTTACIILSRGGPETLICRISSMEVEARIQFNKISNALWSKIK